MPRMFEDTDRVKTRLVSRVQIAQAILELGENGLPADQWLETLARDYYIDIDTFNEVVGISGSQAAVAPS